MSRYVYFVRSGLPGCLPVVCEPYKTKRSANAAMLRIKRDHQDLGRSVFGSYRNDWYIIPDANMYIECVRYAATDNLLIQWDINYEELS